MSRQTFSINFYCRSSKADKKGYAPIEVSLVINGERSYLKLQRKEKPEDFKKMMESKRDNEIKVYCENQRIRINSLVEDMEFADIELTAENLKECLKRGAVSNFYSLGQLWSDIIDNKRSEMKLGDIEVDTFRRYDVAKNAFYEANGFSDETPAKMVELQHIINYQQFLRNQGKEQCTIYNYQSRCKSAFTYAFNRGKIKSNPYAGFKMNKGERKEIVFLTEAELDILKEKQMIERLSRIRDLFLFQCYSGLAYSDMASLEKTDYQTNGKGQYCIQKHRKKTNQLFTSIVLKGGVEILKKYDFCLPVLSNEKYNAYLKEIQLICDIDKKLHTHLGRTTYICLLYNKGVSIDTISAIVGHSSCHTTLKYYARMDKDTMIEELVERAVAEKTPSEKGLINEKDDTAYKKRKAATEEKDKKIRENLSKNGIDIE